jgi:hypothetical protein
MVLALVVWTIRVGSYPSRGERISRTARPAAFWSVMTAGGVMGLLFIFLGLFAR